MSGDIYRNSVGSQIEAIRAMSNVEVKIVIEAKEKKRRSTEKKLKKDRSRFR